MTSNDLRKFIKQTLDTVVTSYYHDAIDNAMFPHAVFDYNSIDLGDINRDDYILTIDVWHKNNQFGAEDIADQLCELLNNKNMPQANFLPTFFRTSRRNLPDTDKDINHIQIQFLIESYSI